MKLLVLTHAETFAHDLGLYNRDQADRKALAERKWRGRTLAPKPRLPCDHGLFSDEAQQIDLIEMLQNPVED